MDEPEADAIVCPFCDYKADGDYQIMLHMETLHPEGGESPFVAREDASVAALKEREEEEAGEEYINCPVDGCGEALLLRDLEGHVEMHEEEEAGDEDGDQASSRMGERTRLDDERMGRPGETFDTKLAYALRNLDDGTVEQEREADERARREHEFYEEAYRNGNGNGPSKQYHERRHKKQDGGENGSQSRMEIAKAAWRELLKIPPSERRKSPSPSKGPTKRRLGKSELGPHAHENQMPTWLVKLLEDGDGAAKIVSKLGTDGKLKKVRICPNMTSGIVPVLEQLLQQDRATEYAYLCDPAVKHVSKLKREGGFCGYRNIQMMTSYIISSQSPGHEVFKGRIPSIFRIQDYIENAWDLGINAQGRIETGGIRGTRKYIGTPDAQAMLISLGIACDAQGLKPKRDSGQNAYELLFEAVEAYFMNGCRDFNYKIRCTSLPSVYFQHPGHSMTIVGFERKVNGSRNLIVFDPMFHDAQNVTKYVGERFRCHEPEDLLKAYRRGTKYLKRYNEFELLKLTHPTPTPSITAGSESGGRPPPAVPSAPIRRREEPDGFGA